MLPSNNGPNLPGPSNQPSGSKRQPGIKVALEGPLQWNLKHIEFDGTEKYEEPYDFEDEVATRAVQINWREIIDAETDYIRQESETPATSHNNIDPDIKINQLEEEQNSVPEAGPWHNVAKNLHESLLQINVFLDNLNVLSHTHYMAPLTILDPTQSDPQPDLPNQNRGAQWVWKRKALTDAMSVLDMSIKRMEQSGAEIRENDDYRKRQQFFSELRKMREYWRIRKLGEHITGDLGYKIFGKKYHARQVFDITRRAVNSVYHQSDLSRVGSDTDRSHENAFLSILQVTVPRDLARRATLTVTLSDDLPGEPDLFPPIDDLHFERLRMDAKDQEQIHWKNALNWAQECLICRNAFKELCTDASFIHERRSIIRDGILVTSLGWDKLLKIELKFLPFRELEPTIEDYLNRCLKQIFVASQCNRNTRPQGFVSLPLTQLHELNDFRGPRALSTLEILERNPQNNRFLTKVCKVASHYNLVKMCVSLLKELMAKDEELFPSVNFRFLRSTQTYSIIAGGLFFKQWEQMHSTSNRQTFYLRITHDEIYINAPTPANPLHDINCHQSKAEIMAAIRNMMTSFLASSITTLGKTNFLYVMAQFSGNNMANDGTLAPTTLLYNENATRAILIRFYVNRVPEIRYKKMIVPLKEQGDFIPINYKRIPGDTLFRKFDNLFAFFRESDTCRAVDAE